MSDVLCPGGQLADDCLQACGYDCEAVVIDFVGCVFAAVVVRIAKEGGVCYHNRGVALLPEGPMVGPVDAGDELGQAAGL